MKKLPSWIWSAAAIPLALIAGVMLGRAGSGEKSTENDSADIPNRNIPTRAGLNSGDGSKASSREGGDRNPSADASKLQLTAILESTSRLDRTQRLLAFLDRLPTEQFSSVYADLVNSPMAGIRGSERSLILQAWAERDPMAAVGYLEKNGAEDWERETSLGTWAAIDPAGAFAWASDSEDEGSTNNWMLGTLRGIAAKSPELARDYLMQLEDNRTRSRSLQAMQAYVMQYGNDYAENWIANITDPVLQNRASRSFADDLAELDPARAAEWSAGITDENTRREVTEDVSGRWARQDLEAAKSWVSSLPEETRTVAAEGVARQFARNDPAGAVQWLSSFGDNPKYDNARETVIRETFNQDPALSLDFIASIKNERDRNQNYKRQMREWLRRDAESARAWATTNQSILPKPVLEQTFR